MASPKIETVVKNCCPSVGEGPFWDARSASLLHIDIKSGAVHSWDSQTHQEGTINLDGSVGFAIPCDRGGLVVGLNKTISHVDWDTAEVTKLAEVDQGTNNRFNDGKCDASGRLWAGTMGGESVPGTIDMGQGSLYSISADHKVTKHVTNIDISNGMDWTNDNSIMFYIDSIPRKVYAFDFDINEGTIRNQRTVFEYQPGNETTYVWPDGMCVDSEGKIWVAFFRSSRVQRIDPETGKILQTLEFPVTNVTSVCFGGKNFDELYVTSSHFRLPEGSDVTQPLAGSLFRVTGLGIKGRAQYSFKG